MKSLFTYILIFILLISGYCWPAIINIPVDYPTIQQGIDASVNGDTVLVQPATYVENINFNGHNIVLGSLFLTTGDTSYISSTIIDGDSASSVVIFNHQEDSTAVITGFSLTNGLGAGTNPYFGAGGITCWMYSSPKITRNHIYGNSTYGNSHMGGIYSYASSPIISGNKIFDNQETAITCRTIDATVGYPPLIDNNIIFNNSGNGINCWTSSPIITNNTICGNGNGIRCWESNPIIKNSIVWFNSGPEIISYPESYPEIAYCDIQGGEDGIGNINADPIFVDPYNGNYNVCSLSPCIDAGDPALTDPDGTRSDMGAYFPDHPDCPGGNIWYVSVSGNDTTGDGSLGNPFRTIQHAVDISAYLDTVLILPGIYEENVSIYEKSVTLASNFVFSNDTLDIMNTIVEGDSSYSIIFDIQNNGSLTLLKGLTIRNCDGCTFTNGAIHASGGRIEKCVIENISGYAIYASNTEIIENIIRDNVITEIMRFDDQVVVKGNEIYNNTGSVIMAPFGDFFRAEDNRIYDNEGIIFWCWWNNFPAVFRRNIIYNNHCIFSGAGGIFTTEDTYVLAENNVIFNNTGGNQTYLALFGIDHYETEVEFINNIIWNNSYTESEPIISYYWSIDFSMTYCDVQGGWTGEGNIECDPQFCDPDSGNFYLHYNSCCAGAGQDGENMGVYGIGCWSPCSTYVVGDVNGSGAYDGLDVMYGVSYLKGGPAPSIQCECSIDNILYPAGDVNNSCSYNGLDITYGVAYFKGGPAPIPCQDCPPVR